MLRAVKPKNARSKRALQEREPKEFENAKTAVFVRGKRTSEKVNTALTELAAMKKPDAIPFNKHNDVLPFEDASSIEFWGQKNDASLFVVGSTLKKRPDNLCWVRLFDGQVLDILEMGILDAISMKAFKTSKPGIDMRPVFHFSGPEFSADADSDRLTAAGASMAPSGCYLHLKSLLLDFYRGVELNPNHIALGGLEHVISVSIAPSKAKAPAQDEGNDLASLYRAAGISEKITGGSAVQRCPPSLVHFRVYTAKMIASGTKTPRMELELCGPSFDFELRRRLPAGPDSMTQALRRPKTAAQKNTQGKGKRKNIDTDEMGDMVGRVHLGKQDLSQLNIKKVKALRGGRVEDAEENPAFDEEDYTYDTSASEADEDDEQVM